MKVSIATLVLAVLLTTTAVQTGTARGSTDSITVVLDFNETDLSYKNYIGPDNTKYDIVSMPDCRFMSKIGEPMLPAKSVFVALPANCNFKDIEVSYKKNKTLAKYKILPAQPSVPTRRGATVEFVPPGPVYDSSNMYPGSVISGANVGSLRGYSILSLRVFPLRYNPAERSLILHKEITLTVSYTTPLYVPTAAPEPEQDEFYRIAAGLVVNPDDLSRGTITGVVPLPLSTLQGEAVEYVIITSSLLESEFQRLADWKTKKGVPAKVVNISWIDSNSNYNGNDTQDEIRKFIIDAETTWGTKWVLLGGDTDIIPDRKGRGNVDIPADLYYSCLDGSWNADGDSIYGEIGDKVDLEPDVFVGRASVNSVAEAETFVDKTLRYERGLPIDYQLNITFLAEKLWGSPLLYGGDEKDEIDTNYIPTRFTIVKKYEKYANASASIAISEMNKGPHIINHAGHGLYDAFSVNGLIDNDDADGLTNNPRNFILYTISCLSNGFDHDCVSEHYMNNPNGGTVAYIGNSRSGWCSPGNPGNGPSELYDKEFFNSLFNSNAYHLGEVVADSKAKYIPDSQSDGPKRWLQYAINLLGDPELPIWTDTPESFSVLKPSHIPAEQQTLVINVSGSGSVEDAVVCIQKGDEIYEVSKTDGSGEVEFTIDPGVGKLNVTITKKNYLVYEEEIDVYSVISTDSSGSERNGYLPGENVSVKAEGLSPDTDYTIWIQNDPVSEGADLNEIGDPSGSQESVKTDDSGNVGVTLIWEIPEDASGYQEYDIIFDRDDSGAGVYNADSDGIDSAGVVGFVAPIPELPTVVLLAVGLLVLLGFTRVWEKDK